MAKSAPDTPPPDPRRQLTLDQVLGNDQVRQYLRRAGRGGQLAQALLFTGPQGVGKTTTAWALAREIVAEGGDPATHPRALKIARGVHPDVIELTGKGSAGSGMITVKELEEMTRLEDRLATGPLESPRKFALIDPADMMNDTVANKILKVLEEPPPHALFMLVTSEPGRLLPTIKSRCTEVRLEPVALEALAAWLAKVHRIEGGKARLLAALAEGRPGYALALARAGVLESRGELLDALELLAREGFAAVFAAAGRFLGGKTELEENLVAAMTLLRDALVLKTRGEGALNQDLGERLGAIAGGRSERQLLEAAQCFERAIPEVPYFYHPQARGQFVECLMIGVGKALRG